MSDSDSVSVSDEERESGDSSEEEAGLEQLRGAFAAGHNIQPYQYEPVGAAAQPTGTDRSSAAFANRDDPVDW